MAYRIEGKDIVLSGFEQGIADSPYTGIADMRNVDIISVPGEASTGLAQVAATLPPVMNAVAYTAQNAGDTLTLASVTGLYAGVAISLASNTAGGLSNSIVYYVGNIVGNTFQLFLAPSRDGTPVVISSDGTGTLTTYQYGNQRGNSGTAYAPVSYFSRSATSAIGSPLPAGTLLVDFSNYAWFLLLNTDDGAPANSLIFLGNIGGVGASGTAASAIAVWNNYIILVGSTAIDVAPISSLWFTDGPAIAWDYSWQSFGIGNANISGRGGLLVSQEDGNLYFTTNDGVGSLILNPGSTFDSTDTDTYNITEAAVPLPPYDRATCLAELGQNILIGARGSFVYVWDKISLGFTNLLNIPDTYTFAIVAASQNAYVFAGTRGRIYITNGSGIDLYQKFSDYLTGITNPYIRFRSASFGRNQLYFTVSGTTNAGTALTTLAGIWAIDLESDALRLIEKTTLAGYGATTAMVVEVPTTTTGLTTPGSGLIMGWVSGSTYGIDVGSADPYTAYESYIEMDMIPVGTFLDPFSPSQIEWKTSVPLVSGEGVRLSYRKNLGDAFTTIGESTTAGAISDLYQANFEKAQWTQLKAEIKSTATTPSRTRLTEVRIRDWPSGKNATK